jgi:hypothetical protein
MPEINVSELKVNQQIVAVPPDSLLTIKMEPDKVLPIGEYKFKLQVFDDANNPSDVQTAVVRVVDNTKPTAVIQPIAPVPFGQSFQLDAAQSTDTGGGQIKRYIWTLVS